MAVVLRVDDAAPLEAAVSGAGGPVDDRCQERAERRPGREQSLGRLPVVCLGCAYRRP